MPLPKDRWSMWRRRFACAVIATLPLAVAALKKVIEGFSHHDWTQLLVAAVILSAVEAAHQFPKLSRRLLRNTSEAHLLFLARLGPSA